MEKSLRHANLKSLLTNNDFCDWVLGKKPELEKFYLEQLKQFPEKTETVNTAVSILKTLEEDKQKVPLSKKIEIWEEINNKAKARKRKPILLQSLRYAAVFLVSALITTITYYLIDYDDYENYMAHTPEIAASNETKLILGTGEEIEILTEESNIVYKDKGAKVEVNGKQEYTLEAQESENQKPTYNQVVVPYGRKTKIILPDSTEVWLNAGSRLVYPSPFEKKQRTLFLDGEGYFKVAKDKTRPFIVKTNQFQVEALGTAFNVKAYPDELTEETVMVEGLISLEFRNKMYNNSINVLPNQRVVLSKKDKEYLIQEVNVNDYISWTEGMFIFKDQNLEIVLKRVSRYYNIKIFCSKEIAIKKISGKLDLKDNYEEVLKSLALISNGACIKQENKIYFKQKN